MTEREEPSLDFKEWMEKIEAEGEAVRQWDDAMSFELEDYIPAPHIYFGMYLSIERSDIRCYHCKKIIMHLEGGPVYGYKVALDKLTWAFNGKAVQMSDEANSCPLCGKMYSERHLFYRNSQQNEETFMKSAAYFWHMNKGVLITLGVSLLSAILVAILFW